MEVSSCHGNISGGEKNSAVHIKTGKIVFLGGNFSTANHFYIETSFFSLFKFF